MDQNLKPIYQAVLEGDKDAATENVQAALDAGTDAGARNEDEPPAKPPRRFHRNRQGDRRIRPEARLVAGKDPEFVVA